MSRDLTGFDDIVLGRHVTPSLTTISTPRDELGRRAWALLQAALSSAEIRAPQILRVAGWKVLCTGVSPSVS